MPADEALSALLDPRSVAVIGASDSPHKVGGRPVMYLTKFGYTGRIYPINPNRPEIQGIKAYPDLAALPESPQSVIIGLPGDAARAAVVEAARGGSKLAIVYSSGFGEAGAAGRAQQDAMVRDARSAGMRVLGPNSQGLGNFGTGFASNFSTVFHEVPPLDGPVAVVSQSGAFSGMPYMALRERGIGVRYVIATGNQADLTVSELALGVVQDPDIRLVLLYMEEIPDPDVLARTAALARARDVPIVALKSARSAGGMLAAASHTGAMASEDRVVDAFLRHHGIWRARDRRELVNAVELYLGGSRPRGRRLVVISNSGASCVMAADHAEALRMPLPPLQDTTREGVATILPGFATTTNPVDITAALLSNSGLFSGILPVIGRDPGVDLALIALPVLGAGYDVPRMARDTAAFGASTGTPLAVSVPLPWIAAEFRKAGVPTFGDEDDALNALDQYARHRALLARNTVSGADGPAVAVPVDGGRGRFLDEVASLAWLAGHGLPVVRHRLCRTVEEVRAAFAQVGAPVAVKACSADLPHKSEHGLVVLGIETAEAVTAAFDAQWSAMERLGASPAGVIVAAMARGCREFMLGAKVDPRFGAVVLLGDGGRHAEALQDFVVLMPPFDAVEAREALGRLRIAPLYAGLRGDPPLDIAALCEAAVRLGDLIRAAAASVASIDMNPVIVGAEGEGVVIVDALVERRLP